MIVNNTMLRQYHIEIPITLHSPQLWLVKSQLKIMKIMF